MATWDENHWMRACVCICICIYMYIIYIYIYILVRIQRLPELTRGERMYVCMHACIHILHSVMCIHVPCVQTFFHSCMHILSSTDSETQSANKRCMYAYNMLHSVMLILCWILYAHYSFVYGLRGSNAHNVSQQKKRVYTPFCSFLFSLCKRFCVACLHAWTDVWTRSSQEVDGAIEYAPNARKYPRKRWIIRTCTHIYTYIYMYYVQRTHSHVLRTQRHTCIHTHMHTNMHIYIHTYPHSCKRRTQLKSLRSNCTNLVIHANARTHTNTHTHTYTYTYPYRFERRTQFKSSRSNCMNLVSVKPSWRHESELVWSPTMYLRSPAQWRSDHMCVVVCCCWWWWCVRMCLSLRV
jgi:hypothetical protein